MKRIKPEDRIGTTVNGFYVNDFKRENGRTYLLVTCPICNKNKWMHLSVVTDGKSKSCGCANGFVKKDISGMWFNNLQALEATERRCNGQVIWKCKCKCGNIAYVGQGALNSGNIKSCGCLIQETYRKNGEKLENGAKEYRINGTSAASVMANISIANTSGHKGVSFHKTSGLWRAYITFSGKTYHLGVYQEKNRAIAAREEAEKKLFGNFLGWYASEYPEKWKKMQERKKERERNNKQ